MRTKELNPCELIKTAVSLLVVNDQNLDQGPRAPAHPALLLLKRGVLEEGRLSCPGFFDGDKEEDCSLGQELWHLQSGAAAS